MNARIYFGPDELTDRCILEQTRLSFDSSRNVTTGAVTLLGPRWGNVGGRYDVSTYDQSYYAVKIEELAVVTILDGRDNQTKLFEGQIYAIELKQTDAADPDSVHYVCSLNDYSAWLDRSVAWGGISIAFPSTDQQIIQTLVGQFCPEIDTSNVWSIAGYITSYDWQGKTLRQVLDDMVGLSAGTWRMDFDKKLYYMPVGNAPAAPFDLSTSPDNATSFPVRVDDYKRDFHNPINHCYVMGAPDPQTGIAPSADYQDPVSIQKFGMFSFGLVNDQISSAEDAELRARTEVMQYAYPLETGSFTIWKDGLALGQQVNLHEDWLGIDGAFIIRALDMSWKDPTLVEYKATFGAARPSLERYLRLLDQLTRWKSMKPAVGTPAPGSVTDSSIASPGLSADSIASIHSSVIQGQLTAGQIGSVNAGSIVGQINSTQISSVTAASIQGSIQASQIGSVNAPAIQGSISAGQIGSLNAAVIQGVVVSSQLADGIIDSLSKYAAALQPTPMLASAPTLPNKNNPPGSYYYLRSDGNFYQVSADGTTAANIGPNPDSVTGKFEFYNVGAINAKDIIGLILAGQIGSITAGQITGQIQSNQIGTITAGQITGTLSASQIGGVNASTILGTISANQIGSVNATVIQGQIAAAQIANVNASSITGTIQGSQIANINAATITIGALQDSQIGSVSAGKLIVGSATANTINVKDGSGTTIGYIGDMGGVYGGWFKVFGAGGTSYANANIKSDINGNLAITGASFSVSGGGSTLSTSPTTFDATYSSVAWINDDGSNKSSFVSRGLILYAGGAVIGSLIRSPSGAYGQITLGPNNTAKFQADGNTGLCRADGGFQIASSVVINTSGWFVGPAIQISGNCRADGGFTVGGVNCINTSGQFVAAFNGTSVAASGDIGSASSVAAPVFKSLGVTVINNLQQFVGAGVDCNAGIAGSGFNIHGGGTGKTGTFKLTGTDNNVYTCTFTGGILTNIA